VILVLVSYKVYRLDKNNHAGDLGHGFLLIGQGFFANWTGVFANWTGFFCVRTYVNLVPEKFRWGHPFCGRQSTQPTSFNNVLKPALGIPVLMGRRLLRTRRCQLLCYVSPYMFNLSFRPCCLIFT